MWWPRAANSKIINNIIYENTQKLSGGVHGITFFSSPGGGHLIQNNICYKTVHGPTPCIAANGAGKYTGTGNITANPNFVSAGPTMSGTPDFNLRSSSPAINAGVNLFKSNVTTDFGGGGRPQSGPFEIGAYEFGAAPPTHQPSPPGGLQVQ